MGERRARGGPERDPKPLGDLMRQLVAGRGWGERIALGHLREAWPEVVGSQVAERSTPVSLHRGTLTVRAEGGTWATELALMARSLAVRAGAFLGDPSAVREVRVAAGPGPARQGPTDSSEKA